MATGTSIRDAVAACAERAVDDALDAGAVEGDKCMRANRPVEQMSHTAQIA